MIIMSLGLITCFSLFSFLFLFSAISALAYEARNPEVEALMSIRSALIDPHGALNKWDQDSVDPCSWPMITCSSDYLVVAFGAPSQGLSGFLTDRIANLTNLRQVLLQNNNITGQIPEGLGNLPKLETLDLANNMLFGHVPVSLFMSNSLQYLRLNNNSLSGAIPLTTISVPQLSFLDLSFNNLSGPVPKAKARTFNLAGNPLICERHPPEGCSGSVTVIPLSSFIELIPGKSKSYSRRLGIALGISLSFVTLVLFVARALSWYRFKKRKQGTSNISGQHSRRGSLRLGNLRNFTLKELSYATANFNSKNILGSGGFGNVYKGKLRDGTLVAIKRLKKVIGTTGESHFWAELELISLAIHRNLLRLIGYCATPTEKLLVYPYMSNGSVASRLRGKPALDWNARKKIAIGAARGLLYLHEQCVPKIIHRDVKAANVLLDDLCETVVGDFGLAKLLDHADSHVTTSVRGTVGHIAPEYLSTGQSSEKTDVFSFGIFLLDVITGMRALELGKTISNKKRAALEEWVKSHGEEKVQVLVDKELGNSYDKIEVEEMLQIALRCTQYLPCYRPKMCEVVRMLEGDGVAEKWESPRKRINVNSAFCMSNRLPSRVNACPSNVEDSDDENSSRFSMMMDHVHDDAYAMDLSGPR